MQEVQKPTVGRVVHYVLPEGKNAGQVRPAIVVDVWSATCVNLRVFVDGLNDYPDGIKLENEWKTSILEGNPDQLGRWFWPPRV